MKLANFLKKAGWIVYEHPYQLNLVGFRSNSVKANSFDDTFICFFKDNRNRWVTLKWSCTTDTGTYWLENPMMEKGTAMLQAGQYVDAYALGYHRGQYRALVQVRPVKIRRDYNRNAKLDFMNGKVYEGLFGINIHRARSYGTTLKIDKYSAGCQVLDNADNFKELIDLAEYHASLYGNKFTYGLLDERMQRRTLHRRLTYGASLLAASSVIYSHYKNAS